MSTENPFAPQATSKTSTALLQTEQQRAVAEVQAAMVIARSNPRDKHLSMQRILEACNRPSLASSAVYNYSRGGNNISGASIRLAETITQEWGNLQFGIRELSNNGIDSTVQAFAWDVQTNTRREVTFQVPHSRHTRKGTYALTDPRDIYENVANQGARRLRSCLLAVIPGDVVEQAVEEYEKTLRTNIETTPEAVAKMLEVFFELGITRKQIERRIQRNAEAIQPVQMVGLRKIYVSVKEGMSGVMDWFDPEKGEDESKESGTSNADKVKAKLSKRKPKEVKEAEEEPEIEF